MTSDAKRDANRRNAKKSTGPRSAAGKARSSQNARRHGLFAEPDTREVLRWLKILTNEDSPTITDMSDDPLSAATWRYAVAEARLDAARRAEQTQTAKLKAYLESKDLTKPLDFDRVDGESLICLLVFTEFDVTEGQLALLNARALPRLKRLREDLSRIRTYREKAERMRRRCFQGWRLTRITSVKTKPNTPLGCVTPGE